MRWLISLLSICVGCAKPSESTPSATSYRNEFLLGADFIHLAGGKGFVLPATAGFSASGDKPWVWYAPTFVDGTGVTPMAGQMSFYMEQLRSAGIAVVGCDVGESYGSPAGRAAFLEFYQWLTSHGYSASGGWILQSRGALQGYTFLLEHPEAARAVVGIYPLLTYDDYVGPVGMAPAWNLTLEEFNAVKSQSDPLVNATKFAFSILHLHGDADEVTHFAHDADFTAHAPDAALLTVPSLGHEFYSSEFFAEPKVIAFLKEKLQ